VGFLASLVSLHYVSRIRMPDRHPVPQAVELARSLSQRLRDFKQMIFSSRDFVRFSTASLVFYWGLWFPIPLYSIFWVKTLHASDYWIGLLATVSSAVTIGTYYWWGRVATRRGNRIVLLISTLGMSLYPILTGIAPSVEFLLIPSITSGLLATGFDIATLNATLAVCPKERRPMFVAVYNVLNNLAAFVAPLLGVALAGQVGLPLALLTGGAFRILGFLCFYFLPLQADRTLSAQWD
jgi:MFS family permease